MPGSQGLAVGLVELRPEGSGSEDLPLDAGVVVVGRVGFLYWFIIAGSFQASVA